MRDVITWSDELSVGIEEIDTQHKGLIEMLNRLYQNAIETQSDIETVKAILRELVEYTIVHFATEESLFRIFKYPDTEAHTRQHNELKEQVQEIVEKVERGEQTVNMEMIHFLRKWLRHHIMMSDKKFAPFLTERGVQHSKPRKSLAAKLFGG